MRICAQGRHLHDRGHSRGRTGAEQFRRRIGMQLAESLPFLLAQDADRVEHRVDAGQPGQPPLARRHLRIVGLQDLLAGLAGASLHAHDRMSALQQCLRDRAADEAGGTGEEDSHRREWLTAV